MLQPDRPDVLNFKSDMNGKRSTEPIRTGLDVDHSATSHAQGDAQYRQPPIRHFTVQKIRTYSKERLSAIAEQELQALLAGSSPCFAPFNGKFDPPVYNVDLYKLQYASVVPELGDRPVMASGLVAIPSTSSTSLPVLSYEQSEGWQQIVMPGLCRRRSHLNRYAKARQSGKDQAKQTHNMADKHCKAALDTLSCSACCSSGPCARGQE